MSKSDASATLLTKTLRNILVTEKGLALVVRGTSMLPYLKDKDRVWLKEVNWEQLNLGDLISFELGDVVFTHRVIYKTFGKLLTKGDNNFLPDPPIEPEHIIGRVIGFERNGKVVLLSKKQETINKILGVFHAIIGGIGRLCYHLFRNKWGRFQFISRLGRGFLLPVHILERILINGN